MFKAYKFRLYPNKEQKELINKHIGSARFIYNLALETKTTVYSGNHNKTSGFDLIKQLPELKKECEWLKEVNSQSLQAPIKNLDTAFKRFFNGISKFPKFKSKWRGKQKFHIPQNVSLEDDMLFIPKFKSGIKVKIHRELIGTVKSATISRLPSGKYEVSILCETKEVPKPKFEITENTTIGIDLGIKDFLVTSEGDKVDNPKYLRKAESKLKYVQRKYSKNKGKRTRKKLAKLHEKVANKRRDFLHKQSSKLVKENHSIAVEDLNVKGMIKNHCLAKSISDVGWGMFVNMLKYKCEREGVNLLKIGRFDPSSKTCSNCDNVNHDLTLEDRFWDCVMCNLTHDRDINAAANIKRFALKKYVSGTDTENQEELPTLVGALMPEAHTIA